MDIRCNRGRCVDTDSIAYELERIFEDTLPGQIERDLLKKEVKNLKI
ncbi:MAG: hypothetical protein ACQESG_02755 [Nanobdellota archaeon]